MSRIGYSTALVDRATRAEEMIDGEARICGHDPHWYKPRRAHGFFVLTWRCRRCKVRAVAWVYVDKINAEIPLGCSQ